MSEDKFFKLVNERLSKIVSTLTSKGNEYSRRENKLHNFDMGAQKTQMLREEVIQMFMLKHEISVDDIIHNIHLGKLPTKELVDEKIGDIINYYILLEASIKDKIDKENITSD